MSFIPIIYNIPIFILRACVCVCVFVSHMMIISVSIVASFSIQSIKIKRRQEKWWLLNFYFIVSTDIIYDFHSIRCWTLDNCSFPIWNIFESLFFVVCKFSTANQFDSLFFAIFCFVFFLAVEMCARIDWHFVRYGNVIKYASVQKKHTQRNKIKRRNALVGSFTFFFHEMVFIVKQKKTEWMKIACYNTGNMLLWIDRSGTIMSTQH